MGVGSTGHERSRDLWGRPIEVTYVVTEYEPNSKFAINGTGAFIREVDNRETDKEATTTEFQVRYTFNSSLGSTKLTFIYEYELPLHIRYMVRLPLHASTSHKLHEEEGHRRQ